MSDHLSSPEAKAIRSRRAKLRDRLSRDPLAERARLVQFWRKCAETNPAHRPLCGAWWRPFLTQPGFRHLLMPRLRQMVEARARAHREQHAAEMRAYSKRWAEIKATREAEAARAKQPQTQLF